MRSSLFYIALVFLIFSCSDRIDYNYDYKFDDSKLVVIGELQGGLPAKISVSKSASTNRILNGSLALTEAKVELYKNDVLLEVLRYDDDTKLYTSDAIMEYGEQYKVIVESDGYESVSSNLVTVPFPTVYEVSHNFDIGTGYCGVGEAPYKTNFSLKADSIGANDNIELEIFKFGGIEDNSEEEKGTIQTCSTFPDYPGQCDLFLYQDCDADEVTAPLEFNSKYAIFNEENGTMKWPGYAQIKIDYEVSNYSIDYRKFRQSTDQPVGYDEGFIEPETTYSNIEGGHGVFYGVWRTDTLTYTIDL